MVIDTMVFVYALLRVESQHEQALSALERAAQIIVPDSFFAELGNVVWQWIVFRQLPLTIGLEVLKDAESLVTKIQDCSLKKIVGWVERSETQQSHGSVGFRSSTQPT